MGDPKKQRKKYHKPNHPWKMDRITEEKALSKKYGLKNKREIWRTKSELRGYRRQARSLLGSSGEEVEKESKDLISKLKSLGILEGDHLEDVLGLNVENILQRRLQTVVHTLGLANTVRHARQLVIHRHVMIDNHYVGVPGYMVSKSEEEKIKVVGVKITDAGATDSSKKPEEKPEGKPKEEKPKEE